MGEKGGGFVDCEVMCKRLITTFLVSFPLLLYGKYRGSSSIQKMSTKKRPAILFSLTL